MFLAKALELNSQLSFLYFIVQKCLKGWAMTGGSSSGVSVTYLEVSGKTKLFARPQEPFGRIIVMPPVAIAIVHRELVVEVVVTLAQCDD